MQRPNQCRFCGCKSRMFDELHRGNPVRIPIAQHRMRMICKECKCCACDDCFNPVVEEIQPGAVLIIRN